MATGLPSISLASPPAPAFSERRSSPLSSLSNSHWHSSQHRSSHSDFDADKRNSNAFEHSHSHSHSYSHNPNLNTSSLSNHQPISSSLLSESGVVDRSFENTNRYMAKGRPRGESDLGRAVASSEKRPQASLNGHGTFNMTLRPGEGSLSSVIESSKALSSSRYISALLLPTPLVLGALAKYFLTTPLYSVTAGPSLPSKLESSRITDLLLVMAMTSGTLLAIGGLGYSQHKHRGVGRLRSSSTVNKMVASTKESMSGTLRRLLLRMITVALPYLSMVEIGGFRASLLLLCAISSGMTGSEPSAGTQVGWRGRIASHKWTSLFFVASLVFDLTWPVQGSELASTVRGYAALVKLTLFLQPPLPTRFPSLSKLTIANAKIQSTEAFESSTVQSRDDSLPAISPLIASAEDTQLTLFAGALLGLVALFLYPSLISVSTSVNILAFVLSIGAVFSAAAMLYLSPPSSPRIKLQDGFIVSFVTILIFGLGFESKSYFDAAHFIGFGVVSYFAVRFDIKALFQGQGQANQAGNHTHNHQHHHHHHHNQSHANRSKFTQALLLRTADMPLVHSILLEEESRRIFYFMTINLTFMFVQTFYATVSGSLGLLSDSIHMFFDCMGLLAGLIAAIMSKWPPNERFPYGYGKLETLSGFGNGVFLMLISVEVIWESFERVMVGTELIRLRELLLVSIGGLGVNLIGLLFIGHHHHHGHDHDHGHDHSHTNENMMGIYLHILADTMGSVAVIVSTILTSYTGWHGWDPIASCIIAILIIAASIPLITGSARRLLLTVPSEVEYVIRNSLQEISGLKGVAGYVVPRFWQDDSEVGGHNHEHGRHNHSHSHDHGHHDHHQHEHHHSHAGHDGAHNDCSHSHSNHSHEPEKSHIHSHNHEDSHDHQDHHHHQHDSNESHTHQHKHEHSHSHHHHEHDHEHDHEHEHEHSQSKKLLGVIHVIARRGFDLDDVRARVEEFLIARNMDAVVQVEREGLGRCWCGGGIPKHGRHQSTIVMSS